MIYLKEFNKKSFLLGIILCVLKFTRTIFGIRACEHDLNGSNGRSYTIRKTKGGILHYTLSDAKRNKLYSLGNEDQDFAKGT